jgi:hypothetical protein
MYDGNDGGGGGDNKNDNNNNNNYDQNQVWQLQPDSGGGGGGNGDAGNEDDDAAVARTAKNATKEAEERARWQSPSERGIATAAVSLVGNKLQGAVSADERPPIVFCLDCDYPIAQFGRLEPCTHVFCVDCAEAALDSDACTFCDEVCTALSRLADEDSVCRYRFLCQRFM